MYFVRPSVDVINLSVANVSRDSKSVLLLFSVLQLSLEDGASNYFHYTFYLILMINVVIAVVLTLLHRTIVIIASGI